MTIYSYECENCEYKFDVEQTPSTYKQLKKCPKCKKHRLFRDFAAMDVYYYNECRSLGVQAERNSKSTSYEFQDRKRADKIETGMNKFNDAVSKGVIEKEQAEEMIKKNIDYKPPWGELDGSKKKEIFSGSSEDQAKKVKKYIEKGD